MASFSVNVPLHLLCGFIDPVFLGLYSFDCTLLIVAVWLVADADTVVMVTVLATVFVSMVTERCLFL